jgi:hypothetical protein
MLIEYKIVNGKYIEGYFLTVEDIEKLVIAFQTPDPLDKKHLNIKKEIENYLSHD